MEKATISQLKNSLSAYLKKVRAGQAVLILDREQPIAMLERVKVDAQPGGRLARLEQAGIVRLSQSANPLDALDASQPPQAKASVVDALIEERRDAR